MPFHHSPNPVFKVAWLQFYLSLGVASVKILHKKLKFCTKSSNFGKKIFFERNQKKSRVESWEAFFIEYKLTFNIAMENTSKSYPQF